MQNQIIIAVIAGLGGMLGWGLADLFAKKTIDTIGDIPSLFWAHVSGSVIFFLFFLSVFFSHPTASILPTGASSWLGLALLGILQGVVYLLVYRGFGKGQVSILNPIFASFSGLVALFSVLFLGEHISAYGIAALIIIFVGVILLNTDLASFKLKKISFVKTPGFPEIAIATILAAVWTLSWKTFVDSQSSVIVSAFFMYACMTLAIYIYAKARRVNLAVPIRSMWKFLLLIGICEAVAYAAITWGYGNTSATSVVALVSGAFSLPTIIFARTFLKERVSRTQIVAIAIIIIGIVLVSVI